MRNVVICISLSLALAACGGFGDDRIDLTHSKDVHTAIEQATGPLQDLNIRQQEIPPILVAAAANPYGHAKNVKCDEVKSEVAQLDELLGPDMQPTAMTLASANEGLLDHVSNTSSDFKDKLNSATSDSPDGHSGIELPDRESLLEDAGDLVKDKLMDTIHSQTNILPFRSIIRHLSGANAHQKQLATAYEAGKLRRAYLKGFAEDRFGPQCLAKPIIVQATPSAIVATADDNEAILSPHGPR